MQKSFTISEVLVALVIIGIVASLTIPGLMTKYRQKQVVSKLQVAYKIFTEAVRMSIVENGDISGWGTTSSSTSGYITRENAQKLEDKVVPYLAGAKKYTNSQYEIRALSSNKAGNRYLFNDLGSIYQLPNGMIFRISVYGPNNILTVDINGESGPNILGYDCFAFTFNGTKNILQFFGEGNTISNLKTNGTYGCENENDSVLGANGIYHGMYCGALIKASGWKITNDYPIKF